MEHELAPARVAMAESDRAAIVRAFADEDALRVFAQVVAVTGTGRPQRSEGGTSIGYVTAHGVSRQTGLPVSVVVGAGRRLTEAGLTVAGVDGASWRTDFESLCRAADVERGRVIGCRGSGPRQRQPAEKRRAEAEEAGL